MRKNKILKTSIKELLPKGIHINNHGYVPYREIIRIGEIRVYGSQYLLDIQTSSGSVGLPFNTEIEANLFKTTLINSLI